MRLTLHIAAAAFTAGLALAGSVASAAPAPGALGTLKADAKATSPVEAVNYRCWWRHGHRYCSRYAPAPVFSFYVGPRHHHYRRW
jgi:hypothetical protein